MLISSEFPNSGGDFTSHSGNWEADFPATGSLGTISQYLTTTAGGGLYNIDFYLRSEGGTPSEFIASFGGTQLLDLVNPRVFD